MSHQSLPPQPTKTPPDTPPTPADAPQGHTTSMAGDGRVYVIHVALENSGMAGLVHLTHPLKFEQEMLDAMVAEVVAIVIDTRIVPRRKAGIKPFNDPSELVERNEELFEGDVKYFEAVMCDRHGFRVLRTGGARASLPPTVRV